VLQRATSPLAIVDAASVRVEAANEAFATLVGVPASGVAGMSLLSFVRDSELKAMVAVLNSMASGLVSMSQGRGTWGHRAHQADVTWWIRPLDHSHRGLLALSAVPTNGAAPSLVPLPGEEAFVPGGVAMTHVELDHHWRMEEIALNAEILLGWQRSELLGTALHAQVHPDDIPTMLLILGRASAETGGVAAPLRIRNGDGAYATLGSRQARCASTIPPGSWWPSGPSRQETRHETRHETGGRQPASMRPASSAISGRLPWRCRRRGSSSGEGTASCTRPWGR
jgi:hypothetical protein